MVGNAKYRSMREQSEPIAYVAMGQDAESDSFVNFEVRTDGPPAAIAPSIKAAIGQIDPHLTLDFTPLERQVSESLRLPRTLATLSGFFGVLALLLATIGLYGIMSYSVARRRSEIGVRIALGAAQGRVIRMVVGEVARMVAVGVAIGVALALSVTRLVATFLYGVKPSDPATLALSGATLAVVADCRGAAAGVARCSSGSGRRAPRRLTEPKPLRAGGDAGCRCDRVRRLRGRSCVARVGTTPASDEGP